VATGSTKQVLLGSVTGSPAQPSCESQPTTADCIPSDEDSHSIGALKFGPDGKLYAVFGDGASYKTVDARALRSQDKGRLSGKIVRVDPNSGQGLSDNPFWTGNANDTASKVWAYGFRNAFRFNFKPGTNTIFNGDVGWDTWEEINVINAGYNMGWPCYEGIDPQPGYAAYAQCQALYSAGTSRPPLEQYEHPPDSAVVGGAFTGVNGYKTAFQNTYFWGDYARDQIGILKVDASNNLIPGSFDVFTSTADGPVQIEIGPDGDVWYLSINTGEIRRIHYIGDNRPPVAEANATPIAGLAPLTVNFSSAGSNDPDAGQTITYQWNFGDGSALSTQANPSHQYTVNGTYQATLTVTDNLGLSDVDIVPIQVGNTPPTATITAPTAGFHYDIGRRWHGS
jgi:hypothetical protein